jgi:hypothetical protein
MEGMTQKKLCNFRMKGGVAFKRREFLTAKFFYDAVVDA